MASDSSPEPPLSPHYPGCYRRLTPVFIRVFELEPGNPADPIAGRLVSQTIDGEAYEACRTSGAIRGNATTSPSTARRFR